MKVIHTVNSFEGGYGVSAVLQSLLLRQAELDLDVCVMSLDAIEQSNTSTFIDLRFRPDHTLLPLAKLGRSEALRHALQAAPADLYPHPRHVDDGECVSICNVTSNAEAIPDVSSRYAWQRRASIFAMEKALLLVCLARESNG